MFKHGHTSSLPSGLRFLNIWATLCTEDAEVRRKLDSFLVKLKRKCKSSQILNSVIACVSYSDHLICKMMKHVLVSSIFHTCSFISLMPWVTTCKVNNHESERKETINQKNTSKLLTGSVSDVVKYATTLLLEVQHMGSYTENCAITQYGSLKSVMETLKFRKTKNSNMAEKCWC